MGLYVDLLWEPFRFILKDKATPYGTIEGVPMGKACVIPSWGNTP